MSVAGRWLGAAAGAAVLLAALEVSRLDLDADIFALLPADTPEVEGLRLYQEHFANARNLIVSLRAASPDIADAVARSLAARLVESGLASSVAGDPAALGAGAHAELTAYLWINQPPERFQQLPARFAPGRAQAMLDDTLEQLATSLDLRDVARRSQDPFNLTEILGVDLAADMTAVPDLVSRDGQFRVLIVVPPERTDERFAEVREWVESVTAQLASFQRAQPRSDAVELRITGNPAFLVESGTALLNDMVWAALGTLALVAGLFWLVHRSLIPLLRLVSLLAVVLLVTTALGSLWFGTLNVVSLGFAAILLGITADYGMILHQEVKSHPGVPWHSHARRVLPGILWAAATTAATFFILTRSSLPGLVQLGTLVALGVLVGAGVMAAGFLLPGKHDPARGEPASGPEPACQAGTARRSVIVAAGLLAAAGAVLLLNGPPAVDTGTGSLGPKHGEARAALNEIEAELGWREDGLWIILDGPDEAEIARRLERAQGVMDAAVEAGTLSDYKLPAALWPRPEAQRANRAHWQQAEPRTDDALDAARQAGFSEASLGPSREILEALQRLAGTPGVLWPAGFDPSTDEAGPLLRQFFARDDGGRMLLLGRAYSAPDVGLDDLADLAEQVARTAQVRLASWPLLSNVLVTTLETDVYRVLIPMAGILIVMIAVAFRRLRELVLALLTIAVGVAVLLALMSLLGWSWNLMNIMALAVLMGLGIDYSIHMQFALRRYGGDRRRAHRAVGTAILLCGASTAAGFGMLAFASNAGLAGLGRVAAVGIVLIGLAAVFLLPGWWALRLPAWRPPAGGTGS